MQDGIIISDLLEMNDYKAQQRRYRVRESAAHIGMEALELKKREEELDNNNEQRMKIIKKGWYINKRNAHKKDPLKKSNVWTNKCSTNKVLERSPDEVNIACNTNNIE